MTLSPATESTRVVAPDLISLPANQPPARFYAGGDRIARFRGDAGSAPHTPEDWVGSTTRVFGTESVGMTRLPNGDLLAEAIARNPSSWLGHEHVARYGTDTMLLVKLLDAGQRLPVHAHPDRDFAANHLKTSHGKAEAWYILTPGVVHLGLTDDLDRDEAARLVKDQAGTELLARMHRLEVGPGDSVFVPPGTLHAIGEGILLVEVQEPEDLSILLEWIGFELDGFRDGHLGLGFDLALDAVDLRGVTRAEAEGLVLRAPRDGSVVVDSAAPYFRLNHVAQAHDFPAGLAIVICLDGPAELTRPDCTRARLETGSTTLVPHSIGAYAISGGSVLVARPPEA